MDAREGHLSSTSELRRSTRVRRRPNDHNISIGGMTSRTTATPHISFDRMKEHFRLTIAVAARKLEVCDTVLKRMCRRNGISRWPYRRLQQLDTFIANLEHAQQCETRQIVNLDEKLDQAKREREAIFTPGDPVELPVMKYRRRRRIDSSRMRKLSTGSQAGLVLPDVCNEGMRRNVESDIHSMPSRARTLTAIRVADLTTPAPSVEPTLRLHRVMRLRHLKPTTLTTCSSAVE